MQSQTIQVRLSKRRRLCLILIGWSWKKASKHILILDHLYGEILDPLDITPIRGETTGQTGSQDFSTLFKKQYKDKKVISVGWQENPDLEKIVELEPDLILMTGERKDLYEDLSEIAPTVGYL